MIHGYKRTKKVKTAKEIEEEEALVQKINSKLAEFFSIPRSDLKPENIPKYLEFIGLLMQLVSDIPTVFNVRRQLVEANLKDKSAQEVSKILGTQIKLTTKLIISDPKSYTIWSYRQWLVKSLFVTNPDVIKMEKQLTRNLLMKDEKNFHVWNYRNWLNSIMSDPEEEINFTQQKIKSNPFNFSPYHFRTKLIHQRYSTVLKNYPDGQQAKEIKIYGMPKEQLECQFQRVKTAIFLNPHEEAPWQYYNWLLAQLVPAMVVLRLPLSHSEGDSEQEQIFLNIKTCTFQVLLKSQKATLKAQNKQSAYWVLNNGKDIKLISNLNDPVEVELETTGRLFLGQEYDQKWIEQHIKSILRRELGFIDEVIESEEDEKKCRFAFLQKAAVYKLILQSGTNELQFAECVTGGLEALKAIEKEAKGHKYLLKQVQEWSRLQRKELTAVETALKNKYV